jgi:bifunctional ADP-heptose synthase (sugar kinase/adenylyltransferase)
MLREGGGGTVIPVLTEACLGKLESFSSYKFKNTLAGVVMPKSIVGAVRLSLNLVAGAPAVNRV